MEDRSTHDDLYSLDDRHQNDKLNWKLYEDVTKKHKEGSYEGNCMHEHIISKCLCMLATAWKEQVPEGQQMLKQSSKSTISDYILY